MIVRIAFAYAPTFTKNWDHYIITHIQEFAHYSTVLSFAIPKVFVSHTPPRHNYASHKKYQMLKLPSETNKQEGK